MNHASLLFIAMIFFAKLSIAQIGQTAIGRTTSVGVSLVGPSMPGKAGLPTCSMYNNCNTPECPVFVFIGSGDWRIAGNWANGIIPPEILPACYKIVINPLGNDPCVLLLPQGILADASIYVMPGKRLIIPGRVDNKLN